MLLDEARLRAWLEETQASLEQTRDDRMAADGEDDPTAIRMDGGVANISVILGQLRGFSVQAHQPAMDTIAVPTHSKVRSRALGTSWEAAWLQTPAKSQRLYRAIYTLLTKLGPMTDYQIRDAMEVRQFAHSWSGVSARRNELVQTGWIRSTGNKIDSPNGAPATVWEAVAEEV